MAIIPKQMIGLIVFLLWNQPSSSPQPPPQSTERTVPAKITMLRPNSDGPQIVGSGVRAADVSAWPATLFFEFEDDWCTGTIVGKDVILTAAHCVDSGAEYSVSLNGVNLDVVCDAHPEFELGYDFSADFALCSTSRRLPGVQRYETIASTPPSLQERALLLGFGCTEDGEYGSLFQGVAVVEETTPSKDNSIRTSGDSALCQGDSGGAIYSMSIDEDLRVDISSSRRIIGVGSASDEKSTSVLASTATPDFFGFAQIWALKNDKKICGVSRTARNCR